MIDLTLRLGNIIAAIFVVFLLDTRWGMAEDKPSSEAPIAQGSLSGLEELETMRDKGY